jgi:hypothetical protein
MLDGLALHFIAKYAGPYEILHKSHSNVYTLKLSIDFVAYPTFHISIFFVCDEQRPDQKQRMWLEVDDININSLLKSKAYSVWSKLSLKARNT